MMKSKLEASLQAADPPCGTKVSRKLRARCRCTLRKGTREEGEGNLVDRD